MHAFALKFIMVGDSSVGKSQLSRAFTRKQFNHDAQSTVGMEFSTRTIEFEKSLIKAQLWDTAGQERFESMTKAYYRDALGAALVYDITSRQSFLSLRNVWLRQLREYGHESMRLVLVGNKSDLILNGRAKREVTTSEAIEFARELNIDFIETSALTGYCVESMYRRLVLSVARLLPEVRVHLELTSLPEGWMIQFTETEPQPVLRQTSNDDPRSLSEGLSYDTVAMNSPPSSTPRVQSALLPREYSNSAESKPDVANKPPSPKVNKSIEADESASLTNPLQPPLSDATEVETIRKLTKFTYVNYWTGESQTELPTEPARTNLLFTADLLVVTRQSMMERESSMHVQQQAGEGPRSSIDDRSMTERSSSAKTVDFRRNNSGRDDNRTDHNSKKATRRCRCCIS